MESDETSWPNKFHIVDADVDVNIDVGVDVNVDVYVNVADDADVDDDVDVDDSVDIDMDVDIDINYVFLPLSNYRAFQVQVKMINSVITCTSVL